MIIREQARRLADVAAAIADGKRVTYVSASGVIKDANICFLHPEIGYTIHGPKPEPKW